MANNPENPFEKIKNIDRWFKDKVDQQDSTIEKIKADVKAQETEPCGVELKVKGKVISQTLVDTNQVQSYIKIIDDNKDGYLLAGKELYISHALCSGPSLNSTIEITVKW